MKAGEGGPTLAPTRKLDFEVEVGLLIGGRETRVGERVPIARAHEHMFGVVLVNDWSARDVQAWEYVPLGPFGSKNFATSVSPWVVTLDALRAFRLPAPAQSPPPLDYLRLSDDFLLDIELAADVESTGGGRTRLVTTNARHLYWTFAQQVAHHTVTGCNLRPGDLMASGTVSGPGSREQGCLLEITRSVSHLLFLSCCD